MLRIQLLLRCTNVAGTIRLPGQPLGARSASETMNRSLRRACGAESTQKEPDKVSSFPTGSGNADCFHVDVNVGLVPTNLDQQSVCKAQAA